MSFNQRKYLCNWAPGDDTRAVIVSWQGDYGRDEEWVNLNDDGSMECCYCQGVYRPPRSCKHVQAVKRAVRIWPATETT